MASTRPECPSETASFPSKVTFSWVYDLLKAGVRGRLSEEGLYKPPPWARAHHRLNRFERRWDKQKKERASLMKCLLLCFWKPIAVAWTLAFTVDMLKITQPLMVAALVRYMSGADDVTDTTAYLLLAALSVTSVLIGICFEKTLHLIYTTNMNMRTTCAAAIFQKVTTLSTRARQKVTSGHIVTLMGTDIESFHLGFLYAHTFFQSPIIVLTVGLLEGFQIGVAITAGLAVIVLYVILRSLTGILQGRLKSIESSWTDKRVHLMGEIITAMRVVKMYCWEKPFAARIKELRRKETSVLMKSVHIQYLSLAASYLMGNITSFVSLGVYVALGNHLTPEIAIKLIGWMKTMDMTVYVMLAVGISTFSEMIIAVRRIQDFLNLEDIEAINSNTKMATAGVTFHEVSAMWGAKAQPYALNKMTFVVSPGQLIAVVGPVGAGKSSILMAILRELAISNGELHVNGSVAYVPQESWILSDTVRSNILMNNAMDTQRYEAVVKACALDVDLHDFPKSDLTLVGERGLSLSGGQKARINLARAVYQDADIFLLDDPLSAVDSKVGNTIFHECVCGRLRSKIRILVTHQLQYLKYVDKVIVVDEGRIISMGSFEYVSSHISLQVYVKTSDIGDKEIQTQYNVTQRHHAMTSQHNVTSEGHVTRQQQYVITHNLLTSEKEERSVFNEILKKSSRTRPGGSSVDEASSLQLLGSENKLPEIMDEDLEEKLLKPSQFVKKRKLTGYGTISEKSPKDTRAGRGSQQSVASSGSAYVKYFTAGHGVVTGPIILILVCVKMVLDVVCDWMMSNWGADPPLLGHEKTFLDNPDTFLKTLSFLLLGFVVLFFAESAIIAFTLVTACRRLYTGMFNRVLRAPMVFFEHRPVGQVLNRFSRDTGFMDHVIPYALFWVVENSSRIVAYAIYCVVIFPWMAIAVVFFGVLLGLMGYVSLLTLRALKRIEAQLRSPMYSHLSCMLEGIHVIRAHGLQGYFLGDSSTHLDRHISAWFLYLGTQRHLAVTVDVLVAVLTTLYIAFVIVFNSDERAAGSFGLSFVYFFYVANPIQYVIMCFADLDLAMTSVERILQYCYLDQEAPEHTDVTPPSGWPRNGKMTFSDVTLTYSDNSKPALGPLSMHVSNGEKVGIVGRTGAGKSSFFTSLLRMVEPTGTISIDGVDVTRVGLSDLRSKISVIPQDPMLFSGSLRVNMDPFSEYDDSRLWNVLAQVQLSSKVNGLEHGLETEMGEAGSSFSVGQRQLLCMARALLQNNKIIIIDEATANVDYRTDSAIQNTINTQFVNCTVLTIAHRLETIITYDKIMVLDRGRLVRFGHPHILLQDKEGAFHQMVHQMGPTQARHLEATAKTSYRRHVATMQRDTPPTAKLLHLPANRGIRNMAFSDI